ncbi:hypothetical protein Fleli_1539 [Bernardetia litoralis DSM 6794]|uniref:Uncharacterized protein n=1 Tax=Bernardetia litoralis (strain ATCC 23117 / DSM 6794 / NBRC 15988 / NCIMB 1366 / Fx l1 / Sio-4) TaxID=880071 RepID=I4AJ25_BERLS|nr:hypothetical protein [Bernardetia litoralis]AFM03960.1 hypothetical protein Fleli_1539 [Bernardetia litoralis DSM 6794]
MPNFYKNKYVISLSCSIFLLSIVFFLYIVLYVHTDIQAHINLLVAELSEGSFMIPPLYYFVLYLFMQITGHFKISAIIILSLTMVAKYLVSIQISKNFKTNEIHTLFFIVFTLIVIPINFFINSQFLLGKLNINVWHNSTIIFLMPFALLLFEYSCRVIDDKVITTKNLIIISILILINALAKPSYLFVFLPVFPILFVFYTRKWKKIFLPLLISFYGGVCIIIEYIYIYITNPQNSKDGVKLGFGEVWRYYSNNIPLDLLVSITLPLVVSVLFYKRAIKQSRYIFAVFTFFFAVAIYVFFHETGDRMYHGNFSWQIIACNYILFLVCTLIGLEYIKEKGLRNYKAIIFLITFILHTVSGILYIVKIITEKVWA